MARNGAFDDAYTGARTSAIEPRKVKADGVWPVMQRPGLQPRSEEPFVRDKDRESCRTMSGIGVLKSSPHRHPPALLPLPRGA